MKINKSITQNLQRQNAKSLTLLKIIAQTFFYLAVFITASLNVSAATKIVFSKIADFGNPTSGGIFTMNVDGTNRLQITNIGSHTQPSFSPNGNKIAFADGNGLSIANSDGSGITQLYNSPFNITNPTFSPDGSKILFVSGSGFDQLYVINADGTNVHQINSGDLSVAGGAWSPDGTKIAYGGLTPANSWQIMVMNADGSNKINITNNSGSSENQPSFSPDGNTVVFVGNNQRVYSRNANTIGGSSTQLTTDGAVSYPNYSPDGTKIVYSRFNGIFTVNADGSSPTQIGSSGDQYPRFYTSPVVRGALYDYTGDGKADLAVFRPSNADWWAYDLAGTTEESRKKYLLRFGANGDIPISADYDGDGIMDLAIARPDSNYDAYQIWILQSATSTIHPIDFYGKPSLNDIPILNMDYDGDGKADFVVARYGTTPFQKIQWWIRKSSDNQSNVITFGDGFDFSGPICAPLTGDFDGDGRSDVAVWRYRDGDQYNGWWIRLSATGQSYYFGRFGLPTDTTALADYDGDGKTDIAVYRPTDGVFWINRSSNSATFAVNAKNANMTGNTRPVPADYDGDGKAEVAVFHDQTGTWRIINLTNLNIIEQNWGFASDQLPAAGISPSSFFRSSGINFK